MSKNRLHSTTLLILDTDVMVSLNVSLNVRVEFKGCLRLMFNNYFVKLNSSVWRA